MLPPSAREEEDDGVVRLPDRCSQKRAWTPWRSHPLLLRHLHPSGLSFISISWYTAYLSNSCIFIYSSGLSPHVLCYWWDSYRYGENSFSEAPHISVLIYHCLIFLTDWIPALCPSPAQYGGERGFWDRGAWFYGLCIILSTCLFVFFKITNAHVF